MGPALTRRAALAAFGGIAALGSGVGPAAAAPKSKLLDDRWTRSGAAPGIDHAPWSAFLAHHRRVRADGVAVLSYGAVTPAERGALGAYVAALSAAQPTAMTPAAVYAHWANLYNALTVSLVLDAYPVSSIKRVRGGLFGTGPWREKVTRVEGVDLSLDDIEHGILRPIWRDPRIHYAVNCAAIGCPNLGARAWEAATLEADLDAAARAYVNDPRGVSFRGERLIVSSIYDWFEADFGGTDAGVIAHLRRYAEPALAARLDGRTRIDGDAYDWDLNDA